MPTDYSYFHRLWCRTCCVLVALLLGLAGRSQAQVYYLTSDANVATATANDALYRMNFDGSAMTPLVTSISASGNYLSLDPINNRAFVTEGLSSSPSRGIKVYNNVNTATPTLARVLPVTVAVTAIEYDAASDYVYFLTSDINAATLTATDALNRIKADGSGSVEVLVSSVANAPVYLALSTATNRAYIYEGLTASRGIKTIDLSNNTITGTTIPVTLSGTSGVSALDYDRASGFLYYLTTDGTNNATSAGDAIYRVPGAGTNTTSTPVITSLTNSPSYMALDLENDRIYVADNFNTSPRGFRVVQLSTGTVTATIAQTIQFAAVEIGQPVPPTVTTNTPATSITATSAVLGGNVTNTGTDPVTGRGVVYSSSNTTPAIGGTGVTQAANGSGAGTFSATIGGLAPGTTYYVRAYATSDAGTSYGAPVSFTTLAATAPTVTTAAATSITSASAVLGGNVTADGGAAVTSRGVLYSTTNTTPTIGGAGVTQDGNGTGAGSFSKTISGLTPGTLYYVRAYATNSVGTSYGSPVTFTTQTSVVSIVRANANPTNAGSVTYTVTFANPVTGITVNNFGLTFTGSFTTFGSVSSVSGSGTTYTVTVNTGAGSGTLQLNMVNAAGITPGVSNLTFNGETYNIDKTAPTVSSVAVPANNTYRTGQTLSFTVNFSEAVTVVGTPQLGLTIGSTSRLANYASGSGTTALVFSYTVQAGDADANGIALGTLGLNGGTIRDAATNNATLTLNGVPATTGILVDGVAPTVSSSNRQTPAANPTNATSLTYRVTFSEAVTGVDAADFALSTAGSATGTIASATGVSGSTTVYDVVVNSVSGDGTIRLDVKSSGTGIIDGAGNALNGGYTAGQPYILDQTGPVALLSNSNSVAAGGTTQTTPLSFTATFNEAVTGFDATDISVTNGSASGFTAVSTTVYTFSVTPAGNGTVTVSIAAGRATDAVGNGNTASSFSFVYQQLVMATAQNVTVNLAANGTATLNATSVNNGSTGSGTLTYTIQKVVYGQVIEGQALPLSTPTGENFSAIRFASYGTPTGSNGNYTLGACNASNSTTVVGNILLGNSSGSIGANNTTFGDPCDGTQKNLAVVAAYSANAASLPYTCANVAGPNYVLLTVTDGNGNTSTMTAQVTVVAPPTASFTLNPTSGNVGATITATGSNLSGATALTVNGASATISSLSANGFTFVVPASATVGLGNVVLTTPCGQSPSAAFTVTQLVTAAPVITSPANNSVTNQTTVTISGTAPAGSDVTVYLSQNGGAFVSLGTYTATGGTFSTPAFPFPSTTYQVYATAQSLGAAVSANSATISFTVDTVQPTVAITSSAAANGGTTTTSPIPFSVTFSETVNGSFVQGDLTVGNGTIVTGSFSGSGVGPYTFTVRPTIPGTATTVTVPANVAQDAAGNFNTAGTPSPYAITFLAPTITVAPASLPNGTVGVAYTQALSASGGTAPYAYTLTNGTLPTGLTLSSAGVLSGTLTANGTFSFRITATDNSVAPGPYSGFRDYSVTVVRPTIAVAPASLPGGTVGVAYSQTLTASGGTGAYTYAITAGATPNGLAISQSGVLSGTPTAAGSFNFTVTATDAFGSTGSQAYTVAIAAPTITLAPTTLPNGTQGVAYSQALTASGGTGAYAYAITAGALPSGLSLTNGTIAGTPTVNGTFSFTVTATDAFNSTGSQAYSLVIAAPVVTATSWTGAISTDWFTAGNWTAGVPNSTIDATIPASAPFMPAIAFGTASARNLTLNSGASVTQNGGTLQLAANLTNNGTFTAAGGTVVLGTSTLASILGSSNTRFWNLTVQANGAQSSTSASTSVQRVLTLTGNFTTNGNPFTLESSANLTALVVNNGGVVSGNVTVQRYIDPSLNPGLGYRHYSAPIATATVGSLTTATFTPVVNPTYNTSATPNSVQPFPTVYFYDQARVATATNNNLAPFDRAWTSPGALTDPLTVGQGYTVNLAPQTLAVTGTLNNGDLSQTLTSTRNAIADGGWQLVGNPYPAPLDYSRVFGADRVGLDAAIYVYSSTGQYAGQYRTYVGGVGNPVVPSGQGFFARVALGQASGSLTLRNAQRLTVPNGTTFQRTAETRPLVQLTLQGATGVASDEAYVYFENGATAGFDREMDAMKLANPTGLNVSAETSAGRMAINGLPALSTATVTVPLAVGVPAAGSYTFNAAQLLNLATTPTYLRDKQTGAVVDLAQQPSYSFTVSNASALLTGRFELVFSPQQVLATASAALAQQVVLYPNPAKGSAFLELPASLGRQAVTATLLDALGRQVRTVTLPAQGAVAHQLDLHDLATGVYALRLSTSAGTVVKRLTVE